ncbi:hypothetical protein [Nitrospirillum amazonense]|uniref:Uncharacterized protein n=1 Tax=Nitrospirillum amazonense TaxID=28077 RepID=A0A560K1X4_9PROT|nr:hypothetical protein [Nitrospirillum amazonense]MDG3443785.1 hypothetical protein [Nitrospirillum amazonense]TWB77345.1 hypothetical protein FBZ87_103161 [Nitrospirillum amazonense]
MPQHHHDHARQQAAQPDQRGAADKKHDVREASDPQRLKDEWAMTGHAATKKSRGMEGPIAGHDAPPKTGGTGGASGSKGDWDAAGSGQRGPQGDRSESTAGTATTGNSSRGRGRTS